MTFRNPLTSIGALATGQAGTSRITIGNALPSGLVAAGVTSAIIFWNANGSYYAIASYSTRTVGNARFLYAPDSTTTATEQALWQAGGVTIDENVAFPIGGGRIQPVFSPVFLPYSAGWADIGGGGFANGGYTIDATNYVTLRGQPISSAGATATIATGLPAPKDGSDHYYEGTDVSAAAACGLKVTSAGVLALTTGLTIGHAYSLDNIGYQA